MLLNNEFEVDADLTRTWTLLTDLERVMPCMPGACLDGRDGDNFIGKVKIKVGPIGANFQGTAHFAQKDDATYKAVIAAAGKDPKGQAAVNATIHARLEQVTETRTKVLLDTDLDISGRMAQFGRGAIADVGSRILRQFADNISNELVAGPSPVVASGAAPAVNGAASAPAGIAAAPAQVAARSSAPAGAEMDALSLVLPMIKERFGQAIIGGLLGLLLSWLVFGRRKSTAPGDPTPGTWVRV